MGDTKKGCCWKKIIWMFVYANEMVFLAADKDISNDNSVLKRRENKETTAVTVRG